MPIYLYRSVYTYGVELWLATGVNKFLFSKIQFSKSFPRPRTFFVSPTKKCAEKEMFILGKFNLKFLFFIYTIFFVG